MKKPILIVTVAIAAATVTVPAHAQMDWLTPHLEAQRYNNARRSQRGKSSSTRKSRQRKVRTHKTHQRNVVVRHPQVQVNGQLLQSAVAPIQRGRHTFVPMRSIFEALGATVTYDSENRIITADRGGSGIQITLNGGDSSKMKGRKSVINDGERPFVHNGVTMVPLRLVSEKMGAQVTYIPRPTTPLISITSKTA